MWSDELKLTPEASEENYRSVNHGSPTESGAAADSQAIVLTDPDATL